MARRAAAQGDRADGPFGNNAPGQITRALVHYPASPRSRQAPPLDKSQISARPSGFLHGVRKTAARSVRMGRRAAVLSSEVTVFQRAASCSRYRGWMPWSRPHSWLGARWVPPVEGRWIPSNELVQFMEVDIHANGTDSGPLRSPAVGSVEWPLVEVSTFRNFRGGPRKPRPGSTAAGTAEARRLSRLVSAHRAPPGLSHATNPRADARIPGCHGLNGQAGRGRDPARRREPHPRRQAGRTPVLGNRDGHRGLETVTDSPRAPFTNRRGSSTAGARPE